MPGGNTVAPERKLPVRGPPLTKPAGTLVDALVHAAGGRLGVTFVTEDEQERFLPWSEVLVRARRAAAAYAQAGVRPGDRVALVLRTGPAYLDAFLGAWLAAAVPVPLPSPSQLGHLEEYGVALERMLTGSGAALLVSGGATLQLLGRVAGRVRPRLGWLDAAALEVAPARIQREVEPRHTGLVQFAWGPTTAPRPVDFTHGALAAQVAARVQALRLGDDDVLVSWLSVVHDSGLVGCLLTALARPLSLVLVSREAVAARPVLALRAVARHRGTVMVGPASALDRATLAADTELERCDLSSLRLVLARTEPGATGLLRRFADRFAPFGLDPQALVPAWGLAEPPLLASAGERGQGLAALGVDAGRLARDGLVAPGARLVTPVGRPLPGVEVDVRDAAGRPLPEGRLGQLWLRAPDLLEGSEHLGHHGWLDTGEVGFVVGGALHVHGRRDELVPVHGALHAPDEFEAPLLGLSGLQAVVAAPLPAPRGQEGGLLLLVERFEGGQAAPAALESEVRRLVLDATGLSPAVVELLPQGALPRTGSGRLRRGEAARRWLAGRLTPARAVNPVRLAYHAARSQLAYARLRLRG
ncbi:MAG: AMP-binding protein [Anaeromyxobacter sp.]|nr:AMP-binding protein [Anaeromyxobacter sp.]